MLRATASSRREPVRSNASSQEEALVAEGVSKAFGATQAVVRADLRVRSGEVVAVAGPSGCGKSTLLLVLAGIHHVDAGRVLVEGVDLTSQSNDGRARTRRRRVGVVLQFGALVPELTLAENVALPLLLDRRARRDALRAAHTELDRVGIGELEKRLPNEVSGGQAQRAAVARALVHDPAVVLADEPTGALDSANRRIVLDLLLGLARERGAAVVLVTHDAEVAQAAGRVEHMNDGVVPATPVE